MFLVYVLTCSFVVSSVVFSEKYGNDEVGNVVIVQEGDIIISETVSIIISDNFHEIHNNHFHILQSQFLT